MERGLWNISCQQLNYLKLTRWPNVLMTLLTQLVIIYGFLPQSGAFTALETWQVLLLLMATGLLTASGNVINDIYDITTDRLNKPEKVIVGTFITEKRAFNFYVILTSIAVIMGFILSYSIDKPKLAGLFIVVSFSLYMYAIHFKRVLLAGNILISILVAFVVLITALFELYPPITEINKPLQLMILKQLAVFALFAFLVNLLREHVKDCQDMKGDHATGRMSLAIFIGKSRAARVLAVYACILVVMTGYLAATQLRLQTVSLYYTLFLIMAPLMFIGLKLWTARSSKDFKLLSLACKMVLLFGILGIVVIKFKI